MKKFRLIASILLVMLLFTACGAKTGTPEDNNTLEPLPEIPTYEGTSVADSPFVGSYRCIWSALEHSSTDDPSWEGRVSSLVCNADGTFTLTFDSLEEAGMVTVSGTYKVENDTATCTVKERTGENYLGVELEEFRLNLIDEKELRYKGEQQGLVADRDIFSKEG